MHHYFEWDNNKAGKNLKKHGIDFDEASTLFELKDEYDLSKMTIMLKGCFSPERRPGNNIIIPEPDVAQVFPNDEAVNTALRSLMAQLPAKDMQVSEKKAKYSK